MLGGGPEIFANIQARKKSGPCLPNRETPDRRLHSVIFIEKEKERGKTRCWPPLGTTKRQCKASRRPNPPFATCISRGRECPVT